MNGYGVLLRKEVLEQWRTMRLGIVTLLFLAFGVLSPALARYLPQLLGGLLPESGVTITLSDPTITDAVSQFVKNLGGTLSLAAVLLAMGMVASEKERGTAAFVLSQPAGRGAFIAAKLTALAVTLGIAMVAATAGAWAYTAWLFEAPPVAGFLAMGAMIWLAQFALGALTLLASTLLPSVIAAGAVGFALYVALSLLSALPVLAPFTPPGLVNLAAGAAMGQLTTEALLSIVANGLIAAAAGVAAWRVLRRQEL